MTFHKLEKEIFTFIDKQFPINATTLGIHAYDDTIDSYSKENIEDTFRTLNHYSSSLKKLQKATRGNYHVDLAVLINYLELMVTEHQELELHKRKPSLYPQLAIYSIYFILLSAEKLSKLNIHSIIKRLEKIPTLLEEGKQNVASAKSIPKLWIDLASEISQKAIAYFKKLNLTGSSAEMKEFHHAKKKVIEALEVYDSFLKHDLAKKADEKFWVGRDYFEYLLKVKHGLSITSRELIEYGEKKIKDILFEMNVCSKMIHPHENWKVTINELKKKHPKSHDLIHTYVHEMKKAKNFLRNHDIVTIPTHEVLTVIETPDFERDTLPYAAYQPPAAFSNNLQGYFWVTPVDSKLSRDKQEEILREHSYYSIPITAIHEAYPGHHLQLSKAYNLKSMTAKRMESSLFSEGWALYSEELMYTLGYYKDPQIRLLQLKAMLWRATRIVIDAKLHTGKMSFNEAVNMLVEIPLLERFNAIHEILRYTMNPAQPMSYVMGMEEIVSLKKQFEKKHKEKFKLKNFHDTILGYGCIPINFIRKDLGL